MQKTFDLPPIETDRPLMYQGLSDRFLSGTQDVLLPSEADGIDFEGEYGIVTDALPMGTSANAAMDHVKLLLLINDWSLRAIAPIEMKTGFVGVQAKPACSVAPFAITPDELGEAWRKARIHLTLRARLNGEWFGHPHGREMQFGFHEPIAHVARTRDLATMCGLKRWWTAVPPSAAPTSAWAAWRKATGASSPYCEIIAQPRTDEIAAEGGTRF